MSDKKHEIGDSELRDLIKRSNVGSCAVLRQQLASGDAIRVGEEAGRMDAASAVALYRIRARRVEEAGIPNTIRAAVDSLSLLAPSTQLSVIAYRSETTFIVVFVDDKLTIAACLEIENPRHTRPTPDKKR